MLTIVNLVVGDLRQLDHLHLLIAQFRRWYERGEFGA